MRHYICIIAAYALLAVSCVYPFTPDVKSEGYGFVIDGDLNVGGLTQIKLSYVQPFNSDDQKNIKEAPSAAVRVEGEDGSLFNAAAVTSEDGITTFSVNLKSASPSTRYRLCVHNNDNQKDYVSAWLTPVKTPEIERFWYEANNYSVNFYVSFHGNDDNDKYRLSVDEMWRHHSYYAAELTYFPESHNMINMSPETYYCYSHNEQKTINLVSSEGYSGNRMEGKTVLTVPRTSIKLQDIYKVTLNIQAIDDDSYQFWSALRDNSESTGSLFQTIPNQIIGNIRCQQDTAEIVYGYINASSVASSKIIIRSTDNEFLWDSSMYKYQPPISVTVSQWYSKYNSGYRPVSVENGIYLWAPLDCVDCRRQGGTNIKPSWWNDYE